MQAIRHWQGAVFKWLKWPWKLSKEVKHWV